MTLIRRWVIGGALLLSAIFVAVPVGALLVYFFYHHQLPLAPSDFIAASIDSAVPSLIAIFISLVLGLFAGYYLATRSNKIAKLGILLFRIPLGVPPLIAGLMLLISLGPNSPIGKVFNGRLTDSLAGVTIAQLFAALPFTIEGFRGAFSLLEREAQVVADSLEMGEITRLLVIFTPLIWPSLRSTLVTSYLRAFGEFGAVLIVAYSPASLPIYTYVSFEGSGLPATVIPVIATLVISGAFAFVISRINWPKSVRLWRFFGLLRVSKGQVATVRGEIGVAIEGQVGDFRVDIHLKIGEGTTAIVGSSGSGKTLTLHSLAHHRVEGLKLSFDPSESSFSRRIGYVPQRGGLWRHLSLRENIDLVLSVSDSQYSCDYLIDLFGVSSFADVPITSLSGGQYQRGAIVRAFASNSEVMIMDEPLSQIDVARRREVIDFIREFVVPRVRYLLLVTHDIDEAIVLADVVNIVNRGRVEGSARSDEVLLTPMTKASASALGFFNFVRSGGSLYAFLEKDATIIADGRGVPVTNDYVAIDGLSVERVISTTRGSVTSLISTRSEDSAGKYSVVANGPLNSEVLVGEIVSIAVPRARLVLILE